MSAVIYETHCYFGQFQVMISTCLKPLLNFIKKVLYSPHVTEGILSAANHLAWGILSKAVSGLLMTTTSISVSYQPNGLSNSRNATETQFETSFGSSTHAMFPQTVLQLADGPENSARNLIESIWFLVSSLIICTFYSFTFFNLKDIILFSVITITNQLIININ